MKLLFRYQMKKFWWKCMKQKKKRNKQKKTTKTLLRMTSHVNPVTPAENQCLQLFEQYIKAPALELPSTYLSYIELRHEFESILSSGGYCIEMNIVWSNWSTRVLRTVSIGGGRYCFLPVCYSVWNLIKPCQNFWTVVPRALIYT